MLVFQAYWVHTLENALLSRTHRGSIYSCQFCYSSAGIKLLFSWVRSALIPSVMVGRRPCEPSEQALAALSICLENTLHSLPLLKHDSQLELWELPTELIGPSPTSLEVPDTQGTGSVPCGEESKTDNRFWKINDRFCRQNCFPNKLLLSESVWW